MGLAEKRKAEAIKTGDVPTWESKLSGYAGYPIKLDFNWDTFTAFDEYPLSRIEYLYSDLEGAIKNICSDDMGKEALKEKVSTIHITNTDNDADMKMEIKDKTLFLTARLAGSSFNCHSTSQLTGYIESVL